MAGLLDLAQTSRTTCSVSRLVVAQHTITSYASCGCTKRTENTVPAISVPIVTFRLQLCRAGVADLNVWSK